MSQVRYIFLSHSSDDKPHVEALKEKLEQNPLAKQHNIKGWLDKDNLESGSFTDQFAKAILSDQTVAFILFVPVDAVSGYVKHEVQKAFDRKLNDDKIGKVFPVLPVYPKTANERCKLPEFISDLMFRENILTDDDKINTILKDVVAAITTNENAADKNKLNDGVVAVTSQSQLTNETLNLPLSEQWLCYDLNRQNDQVIVTSPDKPTFTTQIPIKPLLADFPADDLATQLFPDAFTENGDAPQRLRVRTDDPKLAMLPWGQLHSDTVIESSSLSTHYRPGFDALNVTNPLLVIKSELQLKKNTIKTNTHYRLLHEYFNAYLNIRGPIPLVNNRKSLINALEHHKPDFLYFCASVKNGQLQLDVSEFQGVNEKTTLSLEELGQCLVDAEIRPVVVISLIGEALGHYPKVLTENCRMLWVQSTAMQVKSKLKALEDILANTLEQLPQSNDLVTLIRDVSASDRTIQQNLWVYGQSPQIDIKNLKLIHRLRAALLRVLLGREDLKDKLYSQIKKPEQLNQSSCLAYVVTGDETSCPFDVPAQLQQRLDGDDANEKDNSLPLISFPMAFTVEADEDPLETLIDIFDGCLIDRSSEIADTFYKERKRRGYLESNCAIVINWNMTLPEQSAVVLDGWLKAWAELIRDEILPYIPPQTILLNALCIQTEDPELAQQVQDTANKTLQPYKREGIRLIRIVDALGKLKDFEISDFFEDNQHWQENLKFDTYNIDLYDYSDWVYQRSGKGEFDATVRTIWQQYQNLYNDYRA